MKKLIVLLVFLISMQFSFADKYLVVPDGFTGFAVSTSDYSTTSGIASNSTLLGGYSIEEVMKVGTTYYFLTNEVSYGVVTGRIASIEPPMVAQTSTYVGATSGQYLASYLIPSNQMPAILQAGVYSFNFWGEHEAGATKHPTIMGDLYVKNASDGSTIQEFVSLPVEVPRDPGPFQILITITNDVPRDGYAFQLRTKCVNADGVNRDFTSYFGKGYYAGFTMPVSAGLYVPYYVWNLDKTNRASLVWDNNFGGSTNTFKTVVVTNFIQTAGGWDDLVADANNIRVQGGTAVENDYVSNCVTFLSSADTNFANDHVYFTMQIPHSWKTNTTIYPHVHFIQNSTSQTNGLWFMRYKWYSLGDAVPTAWTEVRSGSNAFTYAGGTIHQLAGFPTIANTGISGVGKSISSLLDIKIYRTATTVSPGTVQMKQFDIHIQKDSLGSDEIVTKSF